MKISFLFVCPEYDTSNTTAGKRKLRKTNPFCHELTSKLVIDKKAKQQVDELDRDSIKKKKTNKQKERKSKNERRENQHEETKAACQGHRVRAKKKRGKTHT